MSGEKKSNKGRKKVENPRITLSVRIMKETKNILTDKAKQKDTSVGRIIDELAETM